jgi:uncharacterized protein YndB with AHSA1/START domain
MSHELRAERLIDATPEEVFDAYTDPEQMKGWFTILDPGMMVENEIDLRVGGQWVSSWGFSDDEMFRETQTFEVVDRPHRLVSRSIGSDSEGHSQVTHVEVTFKDEGGKTLMTIVQSGFVDESTRDFFESTAWEGFFDRISAYLAARKTA